MLRIVLIVGVTTLMYLLLCGCTESATQWEHQRQMQEQCRDTAETEQARTACGD